jgi:hypothetical protein
MSRLEIIRLRSSGEPLQSLADRICESIKAEGDRAEVVTIYRRDRLETDVAIHLNHLETSTTKGPSALGLHLASELRELGLVEHSLWEELT